MAGGGNLGKDLRGNVPDMSTHTVVITIINTAKSKLRV